MRVQLPGSGLGSPLRPCQVGEAVDEALDLVGGPLDRKRALTCRISNIEVPRAHELHASPASGEAPEPVGDLLARRPPPHTVSPSHDLSQRERTVPGVGRDEHDFRHLVVLHRENDVGALDGLGREAAAPMTGEIDSPLAQNAEEAVRCLVTVGDQPDRVDFGGNAACPEAGAQEGGREWRPTEVR